MAIKRIRQIIQSHLVHNSAISSNTFIKQNNQKRKASEMERLELVFEGKWAEEK